MHAAIEAPWFVVLTEPAQAITTVWRMHEQGLELYVPIVRQRVKTGRRTKAGQKELRVAPRPMFPGYGFLRTTQVRDLNAVLDVRGVRDVMRIKGAPVLLPHEAVLAVFRKQTDEQRSFLRKGKRTPAFKPGDVVRVDEGGPYTGLIATVDRVDAKGRIEILLGMIRHSLPDDMVVAA